MNAWFDKFHEIDLNRDIEDDRRGDSSGAWEASSHLCGRQLQQPLMVHMVHTHTRPHCPNTCSIILHYGTDDQRQNDVVPCVCGPSGRMAYSSIYTEKGC